MRALCFVSFAILSAPHPDVLVCLQMYSPVCLCLSDPFRRVAFALCAQREDTPPPPRWQSCVTKTGLMVVAVLVVVIVVHCKIRMAGGQGVAMLAPVFCEVPKVAFSHKRQRVVAV